MLIVRVTLNDGLLTPSGFVAPSKYACVIYCRVPDDWVANGEMAEERQELVLEFLYGKTFRNGNEDGSRYVYRNLQTRILTPDEVKAAPWRNEINNNEFHYWHCHATPQGELRKVTADDFGSSRL